MAVNSEGKVSNKENELITAKNDAIWKTMSVDEIHTHIVDNAAVASAPGRRTKRSSSSISSRIFP